VLTALAGADIDVHVEILVSKPDRTRVALL